jgi:hypothetical protein
MTAIPVFYSPSSRGFFVSTIHECMPEDVVEIAPELHAHLLAEQAQGRVIVPCADGTPIAVDRPNPTPEQLAAMLCAAVQRHLDATARQMGYDNIVTAISYADENAVPRFQAEGQALRLWRSQVWAEAIEHLSDQPLPTPERLIAALPALQVLL